MTPGESGLPSGDALRNRCCRISVKAGDWRGKLQSEFVVVGPDVSRPFLNVRNFEAGRPSHLLIVADRRTRTRAQPGEGCLHHGDVCVLTSEDIGESKNAARAQDPADLGKNPWAIRRMDNRFLTDDGIPRIRITVDAMEVSDGNLDLVIEPGFSVGFASLGNTVLRQINAFDLAAHSSKVSHRSSKPASYVEHALTSGYSSEFEQMLSHGSRGCRDGFVTGSVAADVYIGAAPTLLIELGYGRIVIICSRFFSIEYRV